MAGSTARTEDDTQSSIADGFPGRAEFLRLLAMREGRAVNLLRILIARCDAGGTLSERLLALEQLGRFVVSGPSVSPVIGFELLVLAVERVPEACRRVRECLASVLAETSAVRLFAVIGLPNDRGLLAETTDRLAERLLPVPPDELDLAALAGRIVRSSSHHVWIDAGVDQLVARFGEALGDAWAPLRAAAADAVGLLAIRIAALGMSDALRGHRIEQSVRDSPFYQIGRATPRDLPMLIEACRAELGKIRVDLEDRGVSVDIVYSLDAISIGLTRMTRLLPLASGIAADPAQIRGLLAVLARGVVGERSFSQLMADNLRLLARKVIERAGRTGEHYVTSSRREYWKMLGSAAGGGVITAGTATSKFLIKWSHFPLFLDGLFSSLLYAVSFLLIQFLGFTLATKQPSMTAAALAGTIRDGTGPDRLDELLDLIARISRSQFAAAVGNVATVVVVCLLCDLAWRGATGAPFLDPGTARGVIASFDPLGSGTILFAAFTGVLLWLSSLVAGWFENWVVYRRLPEAIEHHRLGKRFGKRRMTRLARGLEHQAAGVGGSVALGFLLGMTKPVAGFFGLPLDVRHVTLSSGALTLAITGVGGVDAVGWSPILWAWAGIAIIGLLNFGVSFALALVVAMRARDVPRGERRTLPWAVLRRFARRPVSFFFPPRDPPPAPPATTP